MTIETHPLTPFLPANAKVLFLGSFPPPKTRWSMEFFYPNWINDFWRIQGLIYFNDKHYFDQRGQSPVIEGASPVIEKTHPNRFDKDKIVAFCQQKGLAFYDTATKVCRLKDNADDNFLEIIEATDIFALLKQIPDCHTIVTTGGKASEELQNYFTSKGIDIKAPKVGECVSFGDEFRGRFSRLILPQNESGEPSPKLIWWRMPSTSRAYPMKLEKKAEYYKPIKTS